MAIVSRGVMTSTLPPAPQCSNDSSLVEAVTLHRQCGPAATRQRILEALPPSPAPPTPPTTILTLSTQGYMHWLEHLHRNLRMVGLGGPTTPFKVCTLDGVASSDVRGLRDDVAIDQIPRGEVAKTSAGRFGDTSTAVDFPDGGHKSSSVYGRVVTSKPACILRHLLRVPLGAPMRTMPIVPVFTAAKASSHATALAQLLDHNSTHYY